MARLAVTESVSKYAAGVNDTVGGMYDQSASMNPPSITTISPLLSMIIDNYSKMINGNIASGTNISQSTSTVAPSATMTTSATIVPIINKLSTNTTTTSVTAVLSGSNFSTISSKLLANHIYNNNNHNLSIANNNYNHTNNGWQYQPIAFSSNIGSISDDDDETGNVWVNHWNHHGFQIPDLHKLPMPIIVLMIIALLLIAWVTIKFVQALWTYFICYLLGFGAKWCPGPDSWAIVTGSTDGIGLAYAKAMAKKGYCLLLLSRNSQKLDKVKAEILNQFPRCPQVKTMAVDFCLDNIYKEIADEIHSLPGHVHVLINNVGMAYKYPEYFTKIPNSDKFISDILNCNILSVTRMTHIVLPMMDARRSGIILNIASYSALFPTPLLTLYSASKIYMDYFSRALHSEYCDRGIIIQSVLPYYVSTNMIRNPGISLMVPSPDQFVASALKTVGVEVRTYGYFAHNVLAFFQSFIVKFLIGNSLNTKIAFRRMKRFRKGCYKRKGLKHKF